MTFYRKKLLALCTNYLLILFACGSVNADKAIDIDGNGEVNSIDLLLLQRHLGGVSNLSQNIQLPTAVGGAGPNGAKTNVELKTMSDQILHNISLDVDGDKDTDNYDLLMMQRHLGGVSNVSLNITLPENVNGSGVNGVRTTEEIIQAVLAQMYIDITPEPSEPFWAVAAEHTHGSITSILEKTDKGSDGDDIYNHCDDPELETYGDCRNMVWGLISIKEWDYEWDYGGHNVDYSQYFDRENDVFYCKPTIQVTINGDSKSYAPQFANTGYGVGIKSFLGLDWQGQGLSCHLDLLDVKIFPASGSVPYFDSKPINGVFQFQCSDIPPDSVIDVDFHYADATKERDDIPSYVDCNSYLLQQSHSFVVEFEGEGDASYPMAGNDNLGALSVPNGDTWVAHFETYSCEPNEWYDVTKMPLCNY